MKNDVELAEMSVRELEAKLRVYSADAGVWTQRAAEEAVKGNFGNTRSFLGMAREAMNTYERYHIEWARR